MRFNDKLVLNKYIFSLFGVESFDEFLKYESSIKEDTNLEKVDEEGISLFYHLLTSRFFSNLKIDNNRCEQVPQRHWIIFCRLIIGVE